MPNYATGSGSAHRRSRGAVLEAYAETDALDRDCLQPPKGCAAVKGQFCCFSDGSQKHIPCVARSVPHSSPVRPGGDK